MHKTEVLKQSEMYYDTNKKQVEIVERVEDHSFNSARRVIFNTV